MPKGPFSTRAPNSEEVPGPPCSHRRTGSSEYLLYTEASTNITYGNSVRIREIWQHNLNNPLMHNM